jgi:hypothetical protein
MTAQELPASSRVQHGEQRSESLGEVCARRRVSSDPWLGDVWVSLPHAASTANTATTGIQRSHRLVTSYVRRDPIREAVPGPPPEALR